MTARLVKNAIERTFFYSPNLLNGETVKAGALPCGCGVAKFIVSSGGERYTARAGRPNRNFQISLGGQLSPEGLVR